MWLSVGAASVAEEERSPSSKLLQEEQEREWQPADHDRPAAHHGRTTLQMGGALALWSVLYWIMMDRNVADWDNPKPLDRFTGKAWRLDNNSLAVNFIAHPLMGGGAYSLARANHHDPATSFGYAFMTSFLWEFVLEYKEKVSVNDFLVTPGTAVPVGEFFYKLGLYLDTAKTPSTGMQVTQWTLGTGVALDRALDGRSDPPVRERDNLGLSKSVWHQFELRTGVDLVKTPGAEEAVRVNTGFGGKLVTIPGYLREGRFTRTFHNAEVSDFALAGEASEHGMGLFMSADTLLGGYHDQRIQVRGDRFHGHAATVGVSMAFRYLKSKANDHTEFREAASSPQPSWSYHVPKTSEQYSAFHMPGPAVDWNVYAGDVTFAMSGRVHPDFVGIGAPAFYDWASANPLEKSKHILHRQGYFYGWGGSFEMASRLVLGPIHVGGNVLHGRYWSQDGLDRHVERLTDDVSAAAHLLSVEGSVGLMPPSLPLSIHANLGMRRWYSRVGDFERRDQNVSRGVRAALTF